ncbi:hypothetical protein BH10CYA1_BH10CYA1_50160 [soil metagenome]
MRSAMNSKSLNHFNQFSTFTNPGLYQNKLKQDLPDDVREIGLLVRANIIHRVTLAAGNQGSNADKQYGDMTKVPWWRQPEDDVLPTASAMLAELYRRDARGFVHDRSEENRLVLTCRFVAILMASILKSKGLPARVRSGFDPYATPRPNVSCDHWITQYWSTAKSRWITIDVDCCLCGMDFDPYDMPANTFEWSADVWLKSRRGEVDPKRYWNAGGFEGLMPISWELFYDFHCIMNHEIIYLHSPDHLHPGKFDKLSEAELKEIDEIAELMLDPDENFEALQNVFESNKKFRLLTGALL